MHPRVAVLLLAACCLSAGCLGASGDPDTGGPTPTPDTVSDRTAETADGATTTRLTPDAMIPDDIIEVVSSAPAERRVSVAVLDLDDGSTVRTVNRTLAPGEELTVPRVEPGAEHRRVLVRIDGTVAFDRPVYTAERYRLGFFSPSNVTVSVAVA